jgi:hypothetical protein
MTNEELHIALIAYRKQVDDTYKRGSQQYDYIYNKPSAWVDRWIDMHWLLHNLEVDLDAPDFDGDEELEAWYDRRLA